MTIGIGQKSGIYWALNPDNGAIVWSTIVGPGGTTGGIQWGTATDGTRIYVAITNSLHLPYTLANGGPTIDWGSWAALDPRTGQLHGSLPGDAKLAEVKFTMGPTLDRSVPIDLTQSPPIQIQRGNQTLTIMTVRGVITIADPPGVGSTGAQRVVGAGVALAATAGGRYIVALAPKANPDPNGMAVEPVVYTVTW